MTKSDEQLFAQVRAECLKWVEAAKQAEAMVEGLQQENRRLIATRIEMLKQRDERIHELSVQLDTEKLRREREAEQASGLLAQLTKTMELAQERGKIMSVLVRRISELEDAA